MNKAKLYKQTGCSRRDFLRNTAVGVAAAKFQSAAFAAMEKPPSDAGVTRRTIGSFDSTNQIDAGLLNVGFAEAGPANGEPVILLHGWPYDIFSYVDVAPLLADAGYHVIVPYLRGYGTTRFLANDTLRNGQPSALAADTIALLNALKIEKAIIAGFDWGARTANIIAALWPERVKGMASVSGYLIGSQAAGKAPLPPQAELQWWYGSSISPPNVAAPATKNTGVNLPSSFGSSLHRNGTLTMPRSTAPQGRSITRIMSVL